MPASASAAAAAAAAAVAASVAEFYIQCFGKPAFFQQAVDVVVY